MSENERLDQAPDEEELAAEPAEEKGKAPKKSKDAKKKAKAKKANKKGNPIVRWLREMKSELKKVQWPSLKQVLRNTGTVILCVLIVGVFIWVFDALAHAVVRALLDLFS